ncbi:MAG: MucB/RseB C-terminal domain-containing protein [Gammaproteobacteria bacterium]|nr:MucB/RseB C-terminal domain-containing protein [Gammaproteobacteria bacterium]
MRVLLKLFVFLLMWSSVNANADTDAMQLLERVGVAAKKLNYDGVFSYQTGNKLQSIRIIHRADEKGEIERLLSLDGVAREVIRSNDLVTCIYPDDRSIKVNRRPLGRGFPSDLLSRLSSAVPYYQVTLGKQGRVADRIAQELVIAPIDNYRYGYRLWVDKESDLLLQSNLIAGDGSVLEKFAFSSVSLGIPISDQILKPQVSGHAMSWSRTEPETSANMAANKGISKWRVVWLPEGFVLAAQQNRLKASNGAAVEQRVYSDGLSSVSVFIEKIRARHSHLHGGSNMGAVNAYGSIIGAHFVTVVGEVPQKTVEKIGASIRYVAGENQ